MESPRPHPEEKIPRRVRRWQVGASSGRLRVPPRRPSLRSRGRASRACAGSAYGGSIGELRGHHTQLLVFLVRRPLGPRFWGWRRRPRRPSSRATKPSLPRGRPVRSCRRINSACSGERPSERNPAQSPNGEWPCPWQQDSPREPRCQEEFAKLLVSVSVTKGRARRKSEVLRPAGAGRIRLSEAGYLGTPLGKRAKREGGADRRESLAGRISLGSICFGYSEIGRKWRGREKKRLTASRFVIYSCIEFGLLRGIAAPRLMAPGPAPKWAVPSSARPPYGGRTATSNPVV